MAACELANYGWRVQGINKVSAQVAGEVCERLSKSAVGLSPATLLDASRDDDAPLHNEFEWRDDVAAEKYRLKQAQGIITNLRVVITKSDNTVERDRSFVVTGERKNVYVPIMTALSNETYRSNLLKQARDDMEVFVGKYRRLTELAEVTIAMENFLKVADG